MVVVVDVPDSECVGALVFAGPFTGVEEFFGQDAVVALDLAVESPLRGEECSVINGVSGVNSRQIMSRQTSKRSLGEWGSPKAG